MTGPAQSIESAMSPEKAAMNRTQVLPYILETFLLIVIGGCAYPISQEMRAQAREDLTYPIVARNPSAYKGETVIWGGIVDRVQNQPQQTVLTILETPIRSRGEPMDEEHGRGRFLARIGKFLDPDVYDGKRVILAGEIVGEETKPLKENQYRYPVVQVREIYLFQEKDYYRRYRPNDYQDRYGYPDYDQSPFKGIQ